MTEMARDEAWRFHFQDLVCPLCGGGLAWVMSQETGGPWSEPYECPVHGRFRYQWGLGPELVKDEVVYRARTAEQAREDWYASTSLEREMVDTASGIALCYMTDAHYLPDLADRLKAAMDAGDVDEIEHVTAVMVGVMAGRKDTNAILCSDRWLRTFHPEVRSAPK